MDTSKLQKALLSQLALHVSCNVQRASTMQYGGQPAATQQQYTEVHGSSSVYVKNLPQDADKLYLYEKFAPYGGISSVKVRATTRSLPGDVRRQSLLHPRLEPPVVAAASLSLYWALDSKDRLPIEAVQ